MSLGYAERLSHREDLGGRLGDPELSETPHVVLDKSKELAELIQDAGKLIVFTGAGISTAAGIPDFRGPQGVWTLQRKGLPLPKLQTSFVYAKPSLTHQALLGLMQSGKLQYICSQNVDSLHLRSGVPRNQLAELHGNCFAERCKKCRTEYVRDFEMDTVGFQQTGRHCSKPGCRGVLVDHILDWEDALPPDELKATEQHASSADVALCLGTSLQIIPAANLPLRTVRAGGKLGIINLQATPKDKRAHVVIHARVDEVMSVIMQHVGIAIPAYTRTDRVLLSHNARLATSNSLQQQEEDSDEEEEHKEQQGAADINGVSGAAAAAAGGGSEAAANGGEADSSDNSSASWSFTLCISSLHGSSCPLPMVSSASVSFLDEAAAARLKPRVLSGQLPWRLSRSCPAGLQRVKLQVTLQLVAAADEGRRSAAVQYVIDRPQQQEQEQQSGAGSRGRSTRGAVSEQQPDGSQVFAFVTQQLDYSEKQQQLIEQLQAAAEESRLAALAAETQAAAVVADNSRKQSSSKSSSKRSGGSAGGGSWQQREGSVSGGSRSRSRSSRGRAAAGRDAEGVEAAAEGEEAEGDEQADDEAAEGAEERQKGAGVAGRPWRPQKPRGRGSRSHEGKKEAVGAAGSLEADEEAEVEEEEESSGGDGNGVDDSDYVGSDSDAELGAGQRGQNTTGRPRKRTKRLNL